jgi:inosose dehydratase
MNLRVGTAPDSWGVWFGEDPRQIPASCFLDEVVEAGYEWIELGPYGYLPTDPSVLKRELKQRNLRVSGTFIMGHIEQPDTLARMQSEALATGALLQELGARYLVLIDDTYTNLFTGDRTGAASLEADDWKRLLEGANFLGRLAKERFGLTLVFHPHAETHVEYEDQIEDFLANTDPQFVNLCLDTGHHAYRGGDPVEFFRKHSSRILYLHLKSVDAEKQKAVAQNRTPFALAVEMGVFCEPSQGVVDFPSFAQSLKDFSYDGWATVEQDMFPVSFDKPLPIARRTRQYLREVGLG